MSTFEKIPLLRFFIPLLCGVYVSLNYEFNEHIIFLLFIISFSLFITERFIFKKDADKEEYRYRWLSGIFLSSTLLFSGILLVKNADWAKHPQHFTQYNYKEQLVITRLEENLIERQNSYRTLMKVIAVKQNNKWYKTKGNVIQYFEKDSAVFKLNYGDCILQKAYFTPVAPPLNPHEFNYSRYLAHNGIYHQSYLKAKHWKYIGKNTGYPLLKISYQVKDYLLKKLENTGIYKDGFALISALLLGMSDNLDADTLKNFSAAGTMHVLCVSGLHVGIFFLLLNYLLAFLDKKKSGRWLKALLILLSIWFYAMLTGLAPSVLRASTMFSVIIIAKLIKKHSCIYNTILFSAILLIIIDPQIITKLGFWLSYLAVLGIVYLYPLLYDLLKFKNKYIEKIWALACVSLAAQIATSPLSIYFFNQFPNYFLFSNIIVVPLVTIIVYMSVGLLLFSFVPYLSSFVVFILSFLLKTLQFIVNLIESLPYSTSVMVINQTQLILLYIFILFLILYFEKIKPIYLKSALICLFLIFAISSFNKIKNQTDEKLTLYSINKSFALELKSGNNAVFIADSTLLKKQHLLSYHVKTNQLKTGIKNVIEIPLEKLGLSDSLYNLNTYLLKNYICFGNNKFVVINDNKYFTANDLTSKTNNFYDNDCIDIKLLKNEHLNYNNSNSSNLKFNSDFIILVNLNQANIENLLKMLNTDFFILSNFIKNKDKEMLYRKYDAHIKDIWDLKSNGAFILNNDTKLSKY